jgi:hypothetical protein
MGTRTCIFIATVWPVINLQLPAQNLPQPERPRVALTVPAGEPLRLYLTGRVSKKLGAPVTAKLLDPVFAFDRQVVPAGTMVLGHVSATHAIPQWQRIATILNGDFTPLHRADVEFTTLKLPDGREIPVDTLATTGLRSIYIERAAKNKSRNAKKQAPPDQNAKGGILATAERTVKDRVRTTIADRKRTLDETVRGPNKKERLIDFLWTKAPYHPQYWRRGTRFDAPLRDPLEFGFASVKPGDLAALGTQPAPDTMAHVRLLEALSSATAKQGQPVNALLTAPVFSADHKLILPEGTRLTGEVVVARKARHFHRSGQLRFKFEQVLLPEAVENLRTTVPGRIQMSTQATLKAAEGTGETPIQVDSEGGVRTKESNTRFLAPVIALVAASRAADNDAGRHHAASATANETNVSGRTLGGSLGFGMLGAAISQSSPYVGMAFGYYGLAWSVYSTVVGRGGEVEFPKNAMMDITFGARAKSPGGRP